jgi:hypothetical protein
MLLAGFMLFTSSCALLVKPLDERTGFSQYLRQTETSIRNDNWKNAAANLEEAKKAWKKIKPLLQVDIDHDYVKGIEDGFQQLDAYLFTKNKANALASILLLQSTWRNIGSL